MEEVALSLSSILLYFDAIFNMTYLGEVLDSKFPELLLRSSLRFELLLRLSLSLLLLDFDEDFRCFLEDESGLSDRFFDFLFRFLDLDSFLDDLRSLLDLLRLRLDPSDSDPESLDSDPESLDSESEPDPEDSDEDEGEADLLFFLLFFLLLLLLLLFLLLKKIKIGEKVNFTIFLVFFAYLSW